MAKPRGSGELATTEWRKRPSPKSPSPEGYEPDPPTGEENLDDQLDDLPRLSTRDQAFVELVLSGETYTEAYDKIFPASERGRKRHTLHVKAHRKARQQDIQDHLEAARRLGMQQGVKTLQAYVAEVGRVKHLAINAGEFTAAARLVETEGKALGHLGTGQIGQASPSLGPGELVASVRLKLGDEAGRRLAIRLGLFDEAESAPATMIDVTPGKESQKS